MNTVQLECFVTVAEYLNFSKASQVLKITQPAVTHQIQALEKVLAKNAVVLSMNADCDVFAVHYDELEAAVTENMRLNRRVADVTDLVVEVLLPPEQRDEERIRRLLADYDRRV